MDSIKRQGSKEDTLNDSWCEVHFQQQHPLEQSIQMSKPSNGQMEKLLLEAQKESRNGSREESLSGSLPGSLPGSKPGSRGSPKSPQSPNNDVTVPLSINVGSIQDVRLRSVVNREVPTDWVWDWSSRPEAIPPSDFNGKFKHPVTRSSLQAMSAPKKGGGWWDKWYIYITSVLGVGAVLGAVAMFVYLKKQGWGPPELRSL